MICASVKRLFLMRLLLLVDRLYIRMRDLSGGRSIALAADTKLAGFAAGVEADKDDVAAAISTPWSSGQVEGSSAPDVRARQN
jgi:hypothetical protein